MQAEDLIQELPKGLIKWYNFHTGSRALCVTGGIEACESLSEALEESGLIVDIIDVSSLTEPVSVQMERISISGQTAELSLLSKTL